MSETLHRYDVKTGWTEVPDPFAGRSIDDESLDELGFKRYAQFGVEWGFQVTVYSDQSHGYLVEIATDTFDFVLAPDLPSMLELVSKLTPMAVASSLQAIRDTMADAVRFSRDARAPKPSGV